MSPQEPVFSKSEGGHALQVWPHPYRGSVLVKSRPLHEIGQDVTYTLSGHDVRIFAQDILTAAGGEEETFIVSRIIAYPVEESGASLLVGVGNNKVCIAADSSPERLETMAANLAAAAAYIRDAPERVKREELRLRERQEEVMRVLFGDGLQFTRLGLKARTAVEAAIEAQDELTAKAAEYRAEAQSLKKSPSW